MNGESQHPVAVVTGAGSGLGRATAHVLLEAGIDCVLVGRREAALQGTADHIASVADAYVVAADVTLDDDRERIVAETLARFGRLDALINNAGVSAKAPLLAHDTEEWRRVMATNLDAIFFLTQRCLPTMRDRGRGRIVNIGSVYGSLGLNAALYEGMFGSDPELGPTRQPAYHASKGGVLNLTRDLAAAVAPWGVTVNTVTPGMFLTEQSEGIVSDEALRTLARMTPAGRLGDPREIGYAVRFLVSDEAAFITGAELVVDGGWSTW